MAEITAGGAAWKLHGIDIPRPEICLASHHDLTGFSFVGLGVGGAAEIHLLGAEQDDTDRAARTLRQAGDQPGGAEDDGNAGTIIGRAGTEIPGIEMPTNENDLIGTLSTLDLADYVPRRRVLLNRRCQPKPDPYRTQRRQPFEQRRHSRYRPAPAPCAGSRRRFCR